MLGASASVALHWYSDTELTVRLVLVPVTLVVGVQLPPASTAPHFTLPVLLERSVAQLMVADESTTSVR